MPGLVAAQRDLLGPAPSLLGEQSRLRSAVAWSPPSPQTVTQCRPNLPCTLRRGPQSPLSWDSCPLPVDTLATVQVPARPPSKACVSPPRPSGTFCLHPHSHSFTMASGSQVGPRVCPSWVVGLRPPPCGDSGRGEGPCVGPELTSHTCPPRTSSRTGSPARTGSCSPGSSA